MCHAIRVLRRELQRPAHARRDSYQRNLLDVELVESRQGVMSKVVRGVPRQGANGPTVAAAGRGDDPEAMTREVGDLRLPHATLHQTPRWKKSDRARRIRRPEYFIKDTDAIVWIGCIASLDGFKRAHPTVPYL